MKKLIFLLCAILLSGCNTHITDLTVVSTRSIEVDEIDVDKLPQRKGVVGQSSVFLFLFIPFGSASLGEAVDDALNKGDGDLMVDAGVYAKGWTVILFGMSTLEVRGTVVNTRDAADIQEVSNTQEVSQ